MKKTKAKRPKQPKKPRVPLRARFDHYNRFKHWWLGGVGVRHSVFRVKGAAQTLLILLIVTGIAYAMAAFYTKSGEFVISLDREMARDGFVISEDMDFSDKLVTLRGDVAIDVNNIDISDIDRNVMNVNGSHNGINYLAYTFYVQNGTEEVKDYQYLLKLKKATKGVEKAAWIMVFINGKMNLYAQAREDGTPERMFSNTEFPFIEYAENPSIQKQLSDKDRGYLTEEIINLHNFSDINDVYQLETTPFIAKDAACTGLRKEIEPGESDKYTIVIWFEGEDPECVNDIIGGNIEYSMSFTY